MRRSRRKPAGRSPVERAAYARYLKSRSFEPTVDDAPAFSQTGQPGEDLSHPTSRRRRKVNVRERIIDHFSEHWIQYAISSVLLLLAWLMIDSRVDLARVMEREAMSGERIGETRDDLRANGAIDREQDLQIREHTVRIQQLEVANSAGRDE